MKPIKIAAFALNASLYVVAGLLFYFILPLSFGPVRFWPQVVIPAVFSVVFGPWVGGLGAALGIFVNDMVIHGNPLLSLIAGVTSNFVMFWLIGYIANKKINWSYSIIGYGAITAVLIPIAYAFTDILHTAIIGASYVIFLFLVYFARKWGSYQIASVIGLMAGSVIIGLTVPFYFYFFAPEATPITLAAGFGYLIWTFATEIPFLLVLGPAIISTIQKAFPTLKSKDNSEDYLWKK